MKNWEKVKEIINNFNEEDYIKLFSRATIYCGNIRDLFGLYFNNNGLCNEKSCIECIKSWVKEEYKEKK